MRRFIRHPSDIPIHYSLGADIATQQKLKDVGVGGLCFSSDQPIQIGSEIEIEIRVNESLFKAKGIVAWSRPEGDFYSVGVEFLDKSTRYSVRMVEQICHIEHYRSEVCANNGRVIDSEQAAKEWVEKYAAQFPN